MFYGDYMKKIFNQEYFKYLIGIFIFTFIMCLLTPITCDDWGNYLVGRNGLNSSIKNAIDMYSFLEGRIVSRIFLNFFTYHKLLWCILNSIQITAIIYCSYKIINIKKNKIVYFFPILSILLVSCPFFAQTYLWLAANMTYLTPTFLSFIIFTYLYKTENYKIRLAYFIPFMIISLIIPMFVENIGCAYVFGLLLWICYAIYKEKRIPKELIIMLIFSAITLIIMLLSPGSQLRLQSCCSVFSRLNLFEKIFINIPNFIKYTLNRNIFLLILMLIPINLFIKNNIKFKYKKVILTMFNIIPILSIMQNIIYIIPVNTVNLIPVYDCIFTVSKWYFIFYWILFILLYLVSIYKLIKNKDEAIKTLILVITSISSCLVMLLVPEWNDRVTVFSTFTLLFTSIKLINNQINIKFDKSFKIIFIIVIIYYSLIFVYNFIFDMRRKNQINQIIDSNEEIIYLYQNKSNMLWGYEPWDEYHDKVFKLYYGIDENVKIEIHTPTIKELYKFIVFGKYRR